MQRVQSPRFIVELARVVIGYYLARHGLAAGEAALIRFTELTKDELYDFSPVSHSRTQRDFVCNRCGFNRLAQWGRVGERCHEGFGRQGIFWDVS